MAKQSQPQPPTERGSPYARLTLRPLYCLAFIAPLMIFFQIGAMFYRTSLLAPEDLGRLLGYFGATAAYLPPLFIVAVLFIQHLAHGDNWQVRPGVLAGMAGESVAWMVPLVAMNLMTGRLLSQAATHGSLQHVYQQILVAVGAGIYEEFIFRLVFISVVMLVMVDLLGLKKEAVAIGAILVGAGLFSLYHFSGRQLTSGESFPWAEFVFRTLAGVYLGGLYLFRGFAISVGTHTFFNLMVIWMHARGLG
ncbi:MAG: CPBP family intramembrane glutamic endopeptidase [Phycisphaerae bacterium]|jgi:hypothetical protein